MRIHYLFCLILAWSLCLTSLSAQPDVRKDNDPLCGYFDARLLGNSLPNSGDSVWRITKIYSENGVEEFLYAYSEQHVPTIVTHMLDGQIVGTDSLFYRADGRLHRRVECIDSAGVRLPVHAYDYNYDRPDKQLAHVRRTALKWDLGYSKSDDEYRYDDTGRLSLKVHLLYDRNGNLYSEMVDSMHYDADDRLVRIKQSLKESGAERKNYSETILTRNKQGQIIEREAFGFIAGTKRAPVGMEVFRYDESGDVVYEGYSSGRNPETGQSFPVNSESVFRYDSRIPVARVVFPAYPNCFRPVFSWGMLHMRIGQAYYSAPPKEPLKFVTNYVYEYEKAKPAGGYVREILFADGNVAMHSAGGIVFLKGNGLHQVALYNMAGQCVRSESYPLDCGQTEGRLDVRALPTGGYVLHIRLATGETSRIKLYL